MYDIINRTNAGIKSSNTYNGLFSVDENGKYWLRILSSLKPIAKGSNLEFVTGEVDCKHFGHSVFSRPDYQTMGRI